MKLPYCHSRREVDPQNGVCYCAHPLIHARDQLVTSEMCRTCKFRDLPPPENFRTLPAPQAPLRKKSVQLVVAKYQEDVAWIERFQELHPIVYDKGDEHAGHPLPNVGREAHTYLYHIVENYDRLAEITVFLQGRPFDHVPDLDEQIASITDETGFKSLCRHVLVENKNGEPVHPGLPLAKLYEEIFREPGPEHFVCHAAACFAVSRERIHAHPRDFYRRALKAACSHRFAAHCLERFWPIIFSGPPETSGIVTAVDSRYFVDFQLFLASLRELNDCSLAVFDLGLAHDQRAWIRKQPRTQLLTMPSLHSILRRLYLQPMWQTWLKPIWMIHSPFDRVLWLDADTIVLRDIAEAFEVINEHPLMVRDTTGARTANRPELYRWLALANGRPPAQSGTNAGVLGLCKQRDRQLLATWAYGVQWAAANPDKHHLVAWWDQGILLWALQRLGYERHISSDTSWNFPCRRPHRLLRNAIAHRRPPLDELRTAYPEAKIVHWYGRNKLSAFLFAELGELFADDCWRTLRTWRQAPLCAAA